MKYYSAIKKNEIMPYAAIWMDLEFVILSEISQKVRHKHHMLSLIYGIQKKTTKKDTSELIYRLEIDPQTF